MSGSDGKYFSSTKKGEVQELRADLNSFNKDKVKDAVKKVIAAMTVGKDVKDLFTDVVKSMQTDDIELKKLVYLYTINYARSQPDKAILIVNTFQKDAGKDSPPLVRALAIRTMGCIRVDRITEYLCEPLAKALKDKDPYVRKTAAVCTAKLYDINRDLVEEQGFIDSLREMISDTNPMVVANAVAALAEISETSGKDMFQIDANMLAKLLAALNECTEWGQVFILDCLSAYIPSAKDAEDIIERVSPRLKHANSAVSMSAVKVIMKYLAFIDNEKLERTLVTEKLPPPLITLLSEHKPEVQYVALRNINLIVQKKPDCLAKEVKHFFCKYNDPIFVKMEKLEIMIKLTSFKNVEQVLMEFKEYATEVDVEFVRKAVRAIGRCAIKLDKAAERCIKVLLELIQTKVNYVVQEAIIVIKDIFRKYPNRYESIIATLCENLDTLDEPEAKASMIWIIGEYADRIDNAPELLESWVETFDEEPAAVQLQLLTAVVKLFLKRPQDAKDMVTRVLNMATENCDNPDLRDRGYVYWRLLSTDPEAAQAVVLCSKPAISDDTFQLDPAVLDVLINNISTLSSIYHKPPEFFVKGGKAGIEFKPKTKKSKKAAKESDDEEESDEESSEEEESEEESEEEEEEEEDSEEEEEEKSKKSKKEKKGKEAKSSGGGNDILDLMGLDMLDMGGGEAKSGGGGGGGDSLADLFGMGSGGGGSSSVPSDKVLLTAAKGKGLQISGHWERKNNDCYLEMTLSNQSSQTLTNFAVKTNKNFLGLNAGPLKTAPIAAGSSSKVSLCIRSTVVPDEESPLGVLQFALKTDLGVLYFQDTIDGHTLFTEQGKTDQAGFLNLWKSIDASNEKSQAVEGKNNAGSIQSTCEANNMFFVAKREVAGKGQVLYFSLKIKDVVILCEITVGSSGCKVCARSENSGFAGAAAHSIASLLKK